MSQPLLSDRINARLAESGKGRRAELEAPPERKPNPIREQAVGDARIRVTDANERQRMEEMWGPRLDAMPADELRRFAQRVLSPLMYEFWQRSPDRPIVREDLLTALAFEKTSGREIE